MKNRHSHKNILLVFVLTLILIIGLILSNLVFSPPAFAKTEDDSDLAQTSQTSSQEITLRICNWEEYIDEGDWGIDEVIDLESGDIFGENSMIDDFEDWYEQTYNIKVRVEYSNFGTNEDLYNMLTLGDTFDLICPSEYMFMKLMSEDALTPLSPEFFDETYENNYYIQGVSPYLRDIFDSQEIEGEPWSKYAAGYMWGITGFVYDPEFVSEADASTWRLITNPEVKRQVTIKDNVRDSYFAAVGAVNSDLLRSEEFLTDPNYTPNLETVMNNTTSEEIERVQDYLQQAKDNVYAFETDSGKADMISGRVLANYQWSGDAVYSMDEAEADGLYLNFSAPLESTNIYFDGWVMLKNGIAGNKQKQHAAEAFINFVSRPDNAIRNMYYIGYTSFISGGSDSRILEYLDWNYGADESEEIVEYDISYFFTGDMENSVTDYVLTVDSEQIGRQLTAQYPSPETIRRSAVMLYFPPEENLAINRMWTNVRCYNLENLPIWGWFIAIIIFGLILWVSIKKTFDFFKRKIKKNNS